MKTTSLLMSCRLLQTTSVTRKCLFLWWKFLFECYFSNSHHTCSYARCTRSVSVSYPLFQGLFWQLCQWLASWLKSLLFFFPFAVPPAYYAHLAAFRARFYMEPETSDSGSVASGPAGRGPQSASHSTRAPGGAAVRPLPALKDNVKRVMFYCWG